MCLHQASVHEAQSRSSHLHYRPTYYGARFMQQEPKVHDLATPPPGLPYLNAVMSKASSSSRRTAGTTRQAVLVACHRCKARKIACNGRRPTCLKCETSGVVCVYDTRSATETRTAALKRKIDDQDSCLALFESLLDRMRLGQGDELLNIVRKSTDNGQLLKILSGLANGTPQESLPISPHTLMGAVLPPTTSLLEYEVVVSHSKAYNMQLSALTQVGKHFPDVFHGQADRPVLDGSVSSYVDARLHRLHMRYWTTTCIPDDMARQMLSLYLKTDHPILGLFDADFVIDELVEIRTQFCSPFLVSSLFFWICQNYKWSHPQACTWSTLFYDEAELLWESVRKMDSITTAAALQYLYLGCSAGEISHASCYHREGTAMAKRLGLICPPTKALEGTPELQRALRHSSWGIFNMLMLRALHFREYVPEASPEWTIPGEVAPGGICHAPSTSLPAYMGQTFVMFSKFWLMVAEFARVYYQDTQIPLKERVSLRFAEEIYQKLLHWMDTTVALAQENSAQTHHAAIFYIFYHSVVIELFRPFVENPGDVRLSSFAYDGTAHDIVTASLNQLKCHLLTFPLHFQEASYCIFWHAACIWVGHAAIQRHDSDPQWHRYFMLSVRAYIRLSDSFKLAASLLRAMLDLALQKGVITIPEARAICRELCCRENFRVDAFHSPSGYLVDLSLALDQPDRASVAVLIDDLVDRLAEAPSCDFGAH